MSWQEVILICTAMGLTGLLCFLLIADRKRVMLYRQVMAGKAPRIRMAFQPPPEEGKVVAMTIFHDRCIVACEYGVYELRHEIDDEYVASKIEVDNSG